MRPEAENAKRVLQALRTFGAPLQDLSVADLSVPGLVFQIGVPPLRIDILTAIDGVEFEEAWENRMVSQFGELRVPVLSKRDLIKNKRAAGRIKDLADLQALGDH